MQPKPMREVEVDEPGRKEIAKRLRQVGALQKWKDADINYLAQQIHVRHFNDGDALIEEQGPGDYLYMVVNGTVRERDRDDKGQLWAEHIWTENQWFMRQSSFEGLAHESEVHGVGPGVLYVIFPQDLSWMLSIEPELWNLLKHETVVRRLRAMPVLATLSTEHMYRLATMAQVVELAAGTVICEPQATRSQARVYFIDWGQVALGDSSIDSTNVITAGNLFHNGPFPLGRISPERATARTKVRLIAFAFSDMEIVINYHEGVGLRLQRPQIRQFLRQVEDFKNLDDTQLDMLVSVTAWEHYPDGRTVSLQGMRGDSLRILVRGAAVVREVDAQGRDRPRKYLVPGDYYGIGSLFRQDRHHVTVRAVTPENPNLQSGWMTSSKADSELLQRYEPGATWLRICYDDLNYLLQTYRKQWKSSPIVQRVTKEVKSYRKYEWQDQDEVIVYDGHRHWLILVGRLMWLLLILGAVMLLNSLLQRGGMGFEPLSVALFAGLALLPAVGWIVADYLNDYFVVTNRRVAARERVILIYESLNEAQLLAVQDTTIGVDFWGNLFSYGTLVVKTAAKSAWVIFDRIPKPRDVQRLITEQQQRVQAEQRVEQREGLRQQIITDLRVGIVPLASTRALPPDMMVSKPKPLPMRIGERIRRFLDRTLFRLIDVLILQPIRIVVRVFKYGGRQPEGTVDEFRGGFLACWWITPEKTVWRKHWWILIKNTWLSFLVWVIVFMVFLAAFSPEGPVPWWVVALILGGVTFWLGWHYANWANDLYVVTNEKLVDIERLPLGFGEKRREGNLDRVQNVVLKIPTVWANLFNIGNVEIQTAATDEGFTFLQVANPREVQREIWRRINIHQANRLRRETATMQTQQAMVLGVYHELMQETGKYKD